MGDHHGALVVAKLNKRVEDRRERVETVHHRLIIAVVLLLLLGGALVVVGANARATMAQERERVVATTRRE
jgi:branched-subunit amino acid permease